MIDAIRRRLASEWRLKLGLSLLLTAAFCLPYFTLQRLVIFPIHRLPLTAVDDAISFSPSWVWVYQSVYVMLTLVPWLAVSALALKRYARGFLLQAAIGFLFFLVVPVEGPRPALLTGDAMYRLLVSYDAPLNSFPSLHVGLSVYTALFGAAVFKSVRRRGLLVALLWVWTLAIAYAAAATKQHYAIDLPAGALLAWACHRWSDVGLPRSFEGAFMLTRALLALFLLLLPLPTAGQVPPPGATEQEEADHEALRRLRATYEQAIRESRLDLLTPHLHADFNGVMVTGRAVNNFAELQQYWTDIRALIGAGGSYTTTLKPERSVILGDIALARGTTDDVVVTDDGTEFRFVTLWNATLQRQDGTWKLRYVQGTMDPVDNPFIREFTRRTLLRLSALALLAGIVVGLAFGIIWQKRRYRRSAA